MNSRIESIVKSATSLFLRQGYTRTQISHIANDIGVSVGTIYHDFSGKKEIMHFVLKNTIDSNFINSSFDRPIKDDIFIGIENEIVLLLDQAGNSYASHLNSVNDYSFESLISDAFDMLAKYAVGLLFIEKNQYDFPFLANHYNAYRKKFFDTTKQYIQSFIEKESFRKVEHLDLTTTMIIEILTWWTMDRRFTSFETSDISLNLAKEICMDNILSAYKK